MSIRRLVEIRIKRERLRAGFRPLFIDQFQ
jgi:hypothetical protein